MKTVHLAPLPFALSTLFLSGCTGTSSQPTPDLDPSTDAAAAAAPHDASSTVDATRPSPQGPHGGSGDGGTPEEPPPSALDLACTPSFTLQVLDKDAERVARFMNAVDGDPEGVAQEIGRRVCGLLYHDANEVRDATHLKLTLDFAPGEVAWKAGDGAAIEVMISTDHLRRVAEQGRDVAREVRGILHHEMTHMYQNDDGDGGGVDLGLIEGIADFVRIQAGFAPDGAAPNPDGHWRDGYTTTAFFLVWLDAKVPDFVVRLNRSMSNDDGKAWSEDTFVDITGATADALWNDYRATF